jgi:hypothetical protein
VPSAHSPPIHPISWKTETILKKKKKERKKEKEEEIEPLSKTPQIGQRTLEHRTACT